MSQIVPIIGPAESAALHQLLATVSASEDRIISASEKMTELAERTASAMCQQIEQLMNQQTELQKALIETTSQTKQTRQVSLAQTRLVAEKMRPEIELYEQIRKRILETNRAIRRELNRRPDSGDVENLLCAHHGVNLVYDLEKFQTMQNEWVEIQESKWNKATIFLYFIREKKRWLKEYFYPGKNSALAPPVWERDITQEEVSRSEKEAKQNIYVRVGPFGPFPVDPVERYIFPALQEKAAPQASALEKKLAALQLKWSQPLSEPSTALAVAPRAEDPLIEQVCKAETTARAIIPRMQHQIDTLTLRNRTLTTMIGQAQRELAEAMHTAAEKEEIYQIEKAQLSQRMEKAQKLWTETITQADEKLEKMRQTSSPKVFHNCLSEFFEGRGQKVVQAVSRLLEEIATDDRFTGAQKKALIARYKQVKNNWSDLCAQGL